MSTPPRIRVTLTPEQQARFDAFVVEAADKAQAMRYLFTGDTRGMLSFLMAMHMLQNEYPSTMTTEVIMRAREWFALDEPESIKGMVEAIVAKFGVVDGGETH